jgi:transposase
MEAIIERCCGLDVHQATVVACVLVGPAVGRPRKEVRTFKTFTQELLLLRDWLQEQGVTHVAMESTGVYWKPVYALLEDHFRWWSATRSTSKTCPGARRT